MRIQIVMSLVGRLLYIFGIFTLIPFIYSVVFETAYWSFLITTSLSLVLGTLLSYYGCESQSFSIRDGFLVVSSTWIFTVILGALPFLGSGILTNVFDALFEATSGITATGATIIYSVDTLPNTFVLWRGLMHWVGGMGIIVLILSFLKNLGADAAHFFNAEASVPKPGVVMPRIQSMATKLWQLYIAFTALCFLMLWAGGIEPFDALNYAFSIIATGGFAPTSAVAFTDEQNETIRKDLIREARRCGITIGMRKTSVEQLTNAVGISKGSFYKFFDSKELLFFTVLEDIHTECFAAAQRSLQENAAFAPAARAAEAILAACRWLAETKAFVFIEQDADFLLHRLPENVKTAHYHDDETHIRALLEAGGLQPKGGMALAAATVRGLILTVSHQEQIGALYPQVLETLVRGACRELFA